jgi:hypothetical protein
MEPDDLLCSRNARPPKALVGRAQWEINQAPSLKRKRASLEGSSVISLDERSRTKHRCRSEREKQASLDGLLYGGRSMRAVEDHWKPPLERLGSTCLLDI